MDANLAGASADARQERIARLLSPRSVAIVGMSSKASGTSYVVLKNLLANGFSGPIHLIGRTAGEVEGRPITTDLAALPSGVDLAVLAVPASGVGEALATCADRDVGAAVVFAAGFAEMGEETRAEQERIGALVRARGPVVLGPNCIGYTNFRTGFTISFTNVAKVARVGAQRRDGVAIVAQSGGLAGHLRQALEAKNVPVTYNISTGNEMDLSLADFVDQLWDDEATAVIMVYAEHVREPAAFLAAARRAQAAGKPVVMLHPGRSSKAKAAAQSHTGALTGDYQVMRTFVERAGVVLVETLDELLDAAELLSRHPTPSPGGLGIVTFSGAFCGVAHDFCEDIGVEIAPLSPQTVEALGPQMPSYIAPANPLDLGTQPLWQPELLGVGLKAMLADPGVGVVAVSIPVGSPAKGPQWLEQVVEARATSDKPLALALLGDTSRLHEGMAERARETGLVLTRSSDRMLRAMGRLLRRSPAAPVAAREAPITGLPLLKPGAAPEWKGKAWLAAAGLKTPAGGLVQTGDEAARLAAEIGYPVVLKAQASTLAHKTEAGGVILHLRDEAALRVGWDTLHANIARAQPGQALDGVLVEAMVGKGVELVVGARRDPA